MSQKEAELTYGASLFAPPDKYKSGYTKSKMDLAMVQVDPVSKFPLFEHLKHGKGASSVKIQTRLSPPYDDVIVYDVEYRLNKYNRRIVENQDLKIKAHDFVLAFGDSFTFGEGVTTGQDYPSQLARKLSPEKVVYNFGKPGYSANDLLFRLQTMKESLDGVKQNEGVAIWYFIDAHLERFFCDFQCYQPHFDFIQEKPRYELIDNKLVYKGTIAETMTLRQNLLYFLAKSEALKFIGIDQYFDYSDIELRTFVAALKEIKLYLEQKKHLKKFYFFTGQTFRQKERIFQLLKDENIQVIDMSDVNIKKDHHMRIPYDRHPTSDFYWIVSEVLKKYLEP